MRIGALADVHGNAPALEAVLADCRAAGVEMLLVAGDVIGYYPYANEVCDSLRGAGALLVRGNHDAYLLGLLPCSESRWKGCCLDFTKRVLTADNLEWLAGHPAIRELERDRCRVYVCHATPTDLEAYVHIEREGWTAFAGVRADVIIAGHTHVAAVAEREGTLFVNPGSCGQPRDGDLRASYAIVDTEPRSVQIRRVAYDVERVREAVRANQLPEAVAAALLPRRTVT